MLMNVIIVRHIVRFLRMIIDYCALFGLLYCVQCLYQLLYIVNGHVIASGTGTTLALVDCITLLNYNGK